MKKKEHVLILGAGNAQIDAIEYCKSQGLAVVGCSYTTVDNGIPYLDFFEHKDIKSLDGIIEVARKYDVKYIYSVGSDVAMPTVMRASETLSLPHFTSAETAENCQSKVKMRRTLGKDFEGNVSYVECQCLEEALSFKDFPAMMKPSDSQGQRGCFKVESIEDIKKEFQTSMNFSHEGRVIIESYLEGKEVSVNAFFVEGEMKFALVSDRESFKEYPGGIIKEHIVPSELSDAVQDKVKEVACEAAKRMGIKDGPAYFQIKLNKKDQPKILEITPRLDGCHMWHLIKRYCGVDLLAACFEYLAGDKPDFSAYAPDEGHVYKLIFFSQQPWTQFSKDNFDDTDAEYSFYYYEDGDKVRRLNGYIEKCGYKITKEAINK
ncbi:MAG: ATP-grasp domain-containing protein [Mogibacterium sp.]|nr:ATP-grasp domain-containing protein [Mogibacterium sp.]